MFNAKSAAYVGFYLGKAEIPLDIVGSIIDKCYENEPLTFLKSLDSVKGRLFYFDTFDLMRHCSQWDLLRSDCESFGT